MVYAKFCAIILPGTVIEASPLDTPSRRGISVTVPGIPRPFPNGTVITLVDYREGAIHRHVVMEKREGWGEEFPADIRNGDWKYQVFNPDGIVKPDDPERCMSCHKSQASSDYVFTVEEMSNPELD